MMTVRKLEWRESNVVKENFITRKKKKYKRALEIYLSCLCLVWCALCKITSVMHYLLGGLPKSKAFHATWATCATCLKASSKFYRNLAIQKCKNYLDNYKCRVL